MVTRRRTTTSNEFLYVEVKGYRGHRHGRSEIADISSGYVVLVKSCGRPTGIVNLVMCLFSGKSTNTVTSKSPGKRCHTRGQRYRILAGCVLIFLLCGSAPAATIAIKNVGGMLCARCEIACKQKTLAAHVMIDLGTPATLLVHEQAAQVLGIERGSTVSLDIDGLVLSDLPAIPTALSVLDGLTRNYSGQLEDVPVVAILGLEAIRQWTVQLDMSAGRIELLSRSLSEILVEAKSAPSTVQGAGALEPVTFVAERNGYWMSATAPDDYKLKVRFGTGMPDTTIDSLTADLAGSAGGDLESLMLGSIDIARYVALRPEDLSAQLSTPTDLILGTNFLKHFRITIDAQENRMLFEPVLSPQFPVDEQAFFLARANEDADAIESYLREYPESRLRGEAAGVLYRLRLDDYPPVEDAIRRSVDLLAAGAPVTRRSSVLLEFADEMLASDRDDKIELCNYFLDAAQETASEDLNALAAYQIQLRRGRICLDRGQLKEARRFLLSAVFGMPRDPWVNYWMGVLYERMDKRKRAWSRYLQALLDKEAPQEAMVSLGRLHNDRSFRADFSMDSAQQLLEGRTIEYHCHQRYSAQRDGDGGKAVRLVEMFTCIDQPTTQAAELGFNGLYEYFENEPVVLVSYHLCTPSPDPLTSEVGQARQGFYDLNDVPMVAVNGTTMVADGGDEGLADRIFTRYKQVCLDQEQSQEQWRIQAEPVLAEDQLGGEILIDGPATANEHRLFVFLCEKLVLAVGGNGILLHRNVCRYNLSPTEGWVLPADQGHHRFALKSSLTDISEAVRKQILALEEQFSVQFHSRPDYIEPEQLMVVVFVQDANDKTVKAAAAFDLRP